MSRTANSLKNIKYSLVTQFFSLLANFITRMVFVKVLNAEYLGLNGLFTNLLSILSFAELGIGPAITYSLYRPLAEKNLDLIKGLMELYKKAYIKIGLFILLAGVSLTPFLDFFIKGTPEINNLNIIFILFIINASISYFFSYKKSFLIANQKRFLESVYHFIYIIIKAVAQIIFLIFTKSFYIYLIIQILVTFLENYTVASKVNQLYPYVRNTKGSTIPEIEKKNIVKNIKAMVFHKVGDVAVNGTDNLILSKFVGLLEVGIYSNYLLITSAIKQIINVFFQSLIASIGNLGATETSEKKEFIFRCIDLLGFWIYGFSTISLLTLINPFIQLWLGEKYLFPSNIVLLIMINLYLYGRRRSVLAFRDALGLFWYDRHKPLVEATINLFLSVLLVNRYGIQGIMIGTMISTLATSFWIEPYILYKFGFGLPTIKYFIRYIFLTILIVVVLFINYNLTKLLGTSLLSFVGKILITALVPNVIIGGILWHTKEFQYIYRILKSRIVEKIKH